MRISEIFPSFVSQKIAPRASTCSPVLRRRNVQRNSVANHGPAAKISPDEKLVSAWYSGMSFQYARIAAIPVSGALNGVSRKTASSLKTEQMASTSPRSHPLPNASINAL